MFSNTPVVVIVTFPWITESDPDGPVLLASGYPHLEGTGKQFTTGPEVVGEGCGEVEELGVGELLGNGGVPPVVDGDGDGGMVLAVGVGVVDGDCVGVGDGDTSVVDGDGEGVPVADIAFWQFCNQAVTFTSPGC